jgi:hypothetical protein
VTSLQVCEAPLLLLLLLLLCRHPAESLLDGLSAVRETAEVSLTSFFGLLLDNTKVRGGGGAESSG